MLGHFKLFIAQHQQLKDLYWLTVGLLDGGNSISAVFSFTIYYDILVVIMKHNCQ